jgi:hypothetical protein
MSHQPHLVPGFHLGDLGDLVLRLIHKILLSSPLVMLATLILQSCLIALPALSVIVDWSLVCQPLGTQFSQMKNFPMARHFALINLEVQVTCQI